MRIGGMGFGAGKLGRGLTLLEMLVAMAILAIGIVGVLRVFSSSIVTSKAAESYSLAAGLAHQTATELERRQSLDPGTMSGEFASAEPGYTWEAEIGSAESSGLQRVRITVFWKAGSRQRHFDMVTYLRPIPEQKKEQQAAPPEAKP